MILYLLQAGGLNEALFNSEWTDMPLSTRKMVIILMSFGQANPTLEIKPFYELSLFAFAQVSATFFMVKISMDTKNLTFNRR